MMRVCSRALVGMVKPYNLMRPESVTLVASRNLSHQKDLPSQPVPPLQQTCDIYLQYMEPMLEGDELKRAKKLVEEFRKKGGVGERLQRSLERKAENSENWMTEDFVKNEFLIHRKPLVSFSSPAAIFPRLDYRDKKGQIRYAAKLILSALDIKIMIENDTLPVDYMKGKPLCMKQHELLFSSCRIPGETEDTMEYYIDKHVTVVHNGQFFKLEVYNSDGSPLTVDQLCVQLERICSASLEITMEPVGILTTQRRDVWHKVYNNLIKDKTNKESVLAIQSSIFTVCLDGAMPPVSDEMYRSSTLCHLLHGGGSQLNSGNRWFDKVMQLIIGEDGTLGSNLSNTVADGVAQMSLCGHFVAGLKRPEVTQSPIESLPVPQKLRFNLTPEIQKDIEEAKQHMNTLARKIDLSFKEFDHFGKNFIKTYKMRPNAFVQMAVKLAYYRLYQQICPSMEYVTLRAFKLGRVSMMNSNSPASVAFVKAFDDPKIQNTEQGTGCLLQKALDAHAWSTDLALRGQDMFSHLWGLKQQAVEEKVPMPDIFTDNSFDKVFTINLGTSYVANMAGCLPCFGPEEPGQYDVLYSIMDDCIDITVATLKSSKTHEGYSTTDMCLAVKDALLDFRTLLEQTTRDGDGISVMLAQ
ncbi:carnitine O-acetyltransferase-like [Plectropomus leopardus]|uniref:carnitine O-acetyltransferase-like n=1 Tax=Plectropomus leopardus TaxID=160734 RepID=UPI001C4B4C8A|nr:carnitine O-acetyltransferase-like [Plectropomus leopardus]